MKHASLRAAAIGAALLVSTIDALALDCPAMPQQSQRDVDVAVGVAVGQLGQASGRQLEARTRTITNDLLTRLPRADRVYLEQMMYATYCSSLRDNANLTEGERNTRIQAYNRELRATLSTAKAPQSAKIDPRDAARADLARLPVDYTPEAFIKSAEEGKANLVRLFLQAGIDPNAADRRGFTALMHAAARGDVAMMEMLLKAGAAVNARTARGGGSALSWAAASGQLPAMRLLLKSGAARDTFDVAFQAALSQGEIEAMRLMLEQGADPRAGDGDTAYNLTRIPERRLAQLPEIFDLMLRRGWTIDTRSAEGETALIRAASDGNPRLVAALIKAGADVNARCECRGIYGGGYSALTLASRKGSEEPVRLLLDAGSQVDVASNDGTALMLAAEGGYTAIVKLLLAQGADPKKARTDEGKTALMSAAGRYPEMVQALLAVGAEVNARDRNGVTPLMYAAQANSPTSLTLLLDAGAQLESTTKRGRTALMLAVMDGNIDAARYLVKRGARIDATDEDNLSIAAHASQLKGEERVRMLALLTQKEPK